MPVTITNKQRRCRIGHRHLLAEPQRTNKIATIADSLVALHSSDPATVYLATAARMKKPSLTATTTALTKKRSVVRHHAMRRTIWVFTPKVAQLAHAATTAKIASAEKKKTLKAFENSKQIKNAEKWFQAATKKIGQLLTKHGPMSAREAGKALPELVVPVEFGSEKHPAKLNAHTKVLQGGGFDAVFVRGEATGGWVSGEYLWSVTSDWLGCEIAGLAEQDAATELLSLWLDRFGPATITDIKWWFGWTATLAKNCLTSVAAEEVLLEDGSTAWVSPGDTKKAEVSEPWVRLLPGLDSTTMGWKHRDWYIDASVVPKLFDRFGNAGPTIWADGEVVGGWIQRPDGSVVYELTKKLSKRQTLLLEESIDQFSELVGDVVVRPRFPAPIQKTLLK